MKCVSFCVLASASAFMLAGVVRAETEAEYANPGWPTRSLAAEQPQPQSTITAPRRALFAPTAAANARRMSAQQHEERRFLKDAAASSRFEVEASRMALVKSSDPGVRSFASTLISHHASAGNELLHMLHGRGMAAPMLANDQRKALNRLAKLQGSKFNREFLKEVALKHQYQDVQAYEKASLVTKEPRLKAWIDRTLPIMREHLVTADRISSTDTKFARAAAGAPQAAAGTQFVRPASVVTQSMGAAPTAARMGYGSVQPGVKQPIAVPSVSSIR